MRRSQRLRRTESSSCGKVLSYINTEINGTRSATTPTCTSQKTLSSKLSTFDAKNKEYWLIEWNTGGATYINNSILQADYFYKMLFSELFSNPRIKNCVFWAASMGNSGDDYNQAYSHWGGMMRSKITSSSNWYINKQATFYPASNIGKIFKYDTKLIDLNWNNWSDNTISSFIRTSFTGIDKNNFFIRPFIKQLTNPLTNQIKLYIYFSNMSSTSITVDYANFNINTPYYACSGNQGSTNYTFKPTFGGVTANYYDVAKINYIKTSALNWGIPTYEPERWFNYNYQSAQVSGGYNYNNSNIIPPYSVGMIEVTLSTNPVACGDPSGRYKKDDIDTKTVNNNFSVYPNPSNDIINFNFKDEISREISIYNLEGKLVYSTKTTKSNNQISFKELPKGIYNYFIKTDFENLNGRFILQ